ncbi:hypothetical protein P7C73_g709, partial [Tremellales sp. Uapishka_1]
MSSRILNVAVVGCGEVAQCVHLPLLQVASDQFRVTALCDISADSLAFCGNRFGIVPRFTSLTEMLSSSLAIDLVVILTADEYHAEQVVQCADAGKHVLIEKPMARTFAEADAIEAARVRNGVVIFVGYMRRYALALQRVKEEIGERQIKYLRVRDIIGDNSYFTSQAGMHLKRFTDFPPTAREDMQNRQRANLAEMLGEEAVQDPRNLHAWTLLGSLGSHDFSAMRDLVGMPEKCLLATRNEDGMWWSAVFAYHGFKAYYEMAIDDVAVFDAHLEVYTGDKRIKIQYDTPYVKGLPIKVVIQAQLPNGDFAETIVRPTYEDTYSLEYNELYAAIVAGKAYQTTPVDAKQDLMLAKMVMESLAPKKEKVELDDDDLALKAKLKKEADEKKAMAAKAAKGGPMGGGGIKKSGGKK